MSVAKIKAAVRRRDGFKCVKCGMLNAVHIAKYGRQLDVHRIVPGSAYATEKDACVTLCKACHSSQPKKPRGTGAVVHLTLPPDVRKAFELYCKREKRGPGIAAAAIVEYLLKEFGIIETDITKRAVINHMVWPDVDYTI